MTNHWRGITAWLLCGSVLTASCASKEARTNAALRKAGLGPQMANCMAGQMAERLSVSQLSRLGDLGSSRGEALVTLTLDEFLDKVRALRDPETVVVVTLSASVCRLIQEAGKPSKGG